MVGGEGGGSIGVVVGEGGVFESWTVLLDGSCCRCAIVACLFVSVLSDDGLWEEFVMEGCVDGGSGGEGLVFGDESESFKLMVGFSSEIGG
jgi:hypothetical protein